MNRIFRKSIVVQAEPTISLRDAHIVSGRVKGAIRGAVPAVSGVLVHMEPYERDTFSPSTLPHGMSPPELRRG